ncbi:hypothetical protein EMCRGX_G019833 [Ephydatia muelleri]
MAGPFFPVERVVATRKMKYCGKDTPKKNSHGFLKRALQLSLSGAISIRNQALEKLWIVYLTFCLVRLAV